MGSWYLVRHGETDWNRDGIIQGQSDPPLNERGIEAARSLGRRIAPYGLTAAYSSDLARASETAKVILEGRPVPAQTDRDLREFSYGEWEGMTLDEARSLEPGVFDRQLGVGNGDFAAPQGETTAQLLGRVRRFYARTIERHDPEENLLIVTHGGPVRALLVLLLGLPREYFWRVRVDLGSLSIISNHTGGRVLEVWNDTGHLLRRALGRQGVSRTLTLVLGGARAGKSRPRPGTSGRGRASAVRGDGGGGR